MLVHKNCKSHKHMKFGFNAIFNMVNMQWNTQKKNCHYVPRVLRFASGRRVFAEIDLIANLCESSTELYSPLQNFKINICSESFECVAKFRCLGINLIY